MVPLFLQLALILLCSIFAFIVMMRKHRKYWPNRGIPSPTTQLISGNFGSLYGNYPSMFQLRDWTRQHGKVYGVQYGWRNALVISDPAMVHELLVTKFEYFHARHLSPIFGNLDTNKWVSMFLARGGRWKRLRTIANPAFTVANLKKCMLLIDDSVKNSINFLEKARNKGESFNIHRHFVEMSFDVIARVALGQRESRQFDTEMAQLAIESMQKYMNTPFDYVGFAFPWFGIHFLEPFINWSGMLRKDPLIILRKQLMDELTARKKLREIGGEQQQKQQRAQVDFIDLFLETEQNEQQQQQTEQCQNEGEAKLNKTALQRVQKRCTLEEITTQLLHFLLAGFDTSANTLSLVSHALALHAEVQAKVQEEIDSVCFDEDPTYEQLSQLKYTEAVVKETLRLLPIATNVLNRTCCQTTTLGDITVEKGTAVVCDILSLHHNKTLWGEDADKFRPERWFEAGQQQLPPFYAFGGGPRICIGMRFAMIEQKLALVRILRKYSIVQTANTEKVLAFSGQSVITPKSVTVGLKLRDGEERHGTFE
ncbi:hypothetical protein niasHT_009204 [Heterodera trifolii]|uniref:Cytochrome P450 monooxygenase n=1 Tax=Heterodera trifolii TaxID=157864 RepID=A0ABD2LYU5_9BILA